MMESDKFVRILHPHPQEAIRQPPPSVEEQIQSKTSPSSKKSLTTATTTTAAAAEDDDDETTRGLSKSKLPSELESRPEQGNEEIDENRRRSRDVDADACEEIIKVLKSVERQNSVTHRLLTAMIVITLAWQLSEVSLILKIREGLSNPFKSLGSIIKGFLPNRHQVAAAIESPSLKIPELSYLGLPGFDSSDSEDDDHA